MPSRRTVLKSIGIGGAVAVGGTGTVAASPDLLQSDVLAPPVSDSVGWFTHDVLDEVATNADDIPEFIVEIESADDKESLISWVDDAEDRSHEHELSDTEHVIATPFEHIIPTRNLNDLSSLTYVERVDYNLTFGKQVVESLSSESSWAEPRFGDVATLVHGGEFNTEGLAFDDDAEEESLGQVVEYIRHDTDATGEGTVCSVLDTGCNVTDEDDCDVFQDRIIDAKDFSEDEEGIEAVEDPDGHGTWCAAAIAADPDDEDYQGVAPDAELLIGKVMDDDGSGDTANIIDGIRWSVDEGADVISMSLGSPIYSESLADAVEDAVDEGVTVIIAVGNSRQTVRWVASPADVDVDGAISVAATNNADPDEMKSAYFSQVAPDSGATNASLGETRGAGVDIACSGMEIDAYVPDENGETMYNTLSGTSMSTPQIAGAALCLLENDDSLTPDEINEQLTETARPAPECGETEVGYGIADIERAIDGETPDETHEDARKDHAVARDEANHAYSGSWFETMFDW